MRTLREAAELLGQSGDIGGLARLAELLGFTGTPLPLDADGRQRFGLSDELLEAAVIRGAGALRALLVVTTAARPLRDVMADVAAAIATRTHVLWLVLAAGGDDTAIGCWSDERRPPRVLALMARRRQVVASDADTMLALAAATGEVDLLTHARWCELLGRDALSRRFYRVLEQRVAAMAASLPPMPADDRAELALLVASRLLFLSFLQTKGWLDGDHDFLAARYDQCLATGGRFHERVLLPLFFGTLNTPISRRAPRARDFGRIPFLNGGLFARAAVEKRHRSARVSDDALGELFSQLLGAFRFTAREEHHGWSEAAIDPEMLGRAFESLMAGRDRRRTGAFYTPQPLVAHVVNAALEHTLGDATLAELDTLTVLDPACGSGAFLVHVLERVAELRRLAGDERPVSVVRREVLARVIHGVDVNPTAVWLCELRLWLSVLIDHEASCISRVPPLPNLDRNVRVGDALAGDAFATISSLVGPCARLVRLRERYARAAGARKAPLLRALGREERDRALQAIDRQLMAVAESRRDTLRRRRARDLFGERSAPTAADEAAARTLRMRAAALRRERQRLRDGGALPFSFPSHFAHVDARGGFRLVIGNPPWVRLHNIPAADRGGLRERFRVFREPSWQPDLGDPTAGRGGFAAQLDLAALFVERSLALAAPGGVVALLVPAKLWHSLSGGALRRLLAAHRLLQLEDWSEAPCSFDAAVYPSVLLAARTTASAEARVRCAVRRRTIAFEWMVSCGELPLDAGEPASPWPLFPPLVRDAFHLLRARGTPLGASALGAATLGVKCGCNDAFVVEVTGVGGRTVEVNHRGRTGHVELELVRPLLRGESLTAWRAAPDRHGIVWTHAGDGAPLRALPTGAMRWLSPWRRQLSARSDLHGPAPWWTLFRIDGADVRRPRVVWGDFGRRPRAALLPVNEPTVPLNSCYVLRCDDVTDAMTITALLNGPLAAAWLNAIAEPARGGWRRYLAWTVSLLPLPTDWPRARRLLAPLTERALLGDVPTDAELLRAALRAYGLRHDDVAPLLAWCG